jgi:LPS sulfotransferase NodH
MKPLYFRHQVSRFVILFVGRTGSTYLQQLLNSHSNIRCLPEALEDIKDRDGQLAMINRSWSPPIIGKYGAVGFKTKLVDVLDPEEFADLLVKNHVRIIHLQRRNRVKAAVSYHNAQRLWKKTGQWNVYNEKDRVGKLYINPIEFKQSLQRREENENNLSEFIRLLDLPTLSIDYSDLLLKIDQTLQRIFEFILIENKPLLSKVKKATSDDLKKTLENFDELRSQYIGTSYEWMFDEVLVP